MSKEIGVPINRAPRLILAGIAALLVVVFAALGINAWRANVTSPLPASDAPVVFALPGPVFYMTEASHFLKGVDMAIAEANEAGLLGRRVERMVAEDGGSFIEGTTLAQAIASDPNVAAVIGHWHSHVTLPASEIYNELGTIMLSPIVSNVALTRRGNEFVFQNIPGDDEIGRQMAYYARDRGYQNLVVLYADNPYGRGLADAFEDAAVSEGLVVVDRRQGFVDSFEMNRTIRLWEALGYDAIFVGYGMPEGGELIGRLRRAGVAAPMLGGDGLDLDLIETLGPHAEGVVVASIFDPGVERAELQAFIAAFFDRYGHQPDVWAVQGYDSIKLLVHAIEAAGTTDAEAVAHVLHNVVWDGALGTYSFNERGEAEGIPVRQKVVQRGVFVPAAPGGP